jgi:hypothetical protein
VTARRAEVNRTTGGKNVHGVNVPGDNRRGRLDSGDPESDSNYVWEICL